MSHPKNVPCAPYAVENFTYSPHRIRRGSLPDEQRHFLANDGCSQNTHVVTRVIHISSGGGTKYSTIPVECVCQFCHAHILTDTLKVAGLFSWLLMTICFILGFLFLIPWVICWIPFFVDSCLDVLHTCPACKRLLGRCSKI